MHVALAALIFAKHVVNIAHCVMIPSAHKEHFVYSYSAIRVWMQMNVIDQKKSDQKAEGYLKMKAMLRACF